MLHTCKRTCVSTNIRITKKEIFPKKKKISYFLNHIQRNCWVHLVNKKTSFLLSDKIRIFHSECKIVNGDFKQYYNTFRNDKRAPLHFLLLNCTFQKGANIKLCQKPKPKYRITQKIQSKTLLIEKSKNKINSLQNCFVDLFMCI
jgi:hypothetical protein